LNEAQVRNKKSKNILNDIPQKKKLYFALYCLIQQFRTSRQLLKIVDVETEQEELHSVLLKALAG